MSKKILILTGVVAGGLGGFLYWKFFGCTDGTCALRSNWMIMTGYGILLGYVIFDFLPFKKKKEQ